MRCKHCKTKFEPKTFLQKYCMETDECMTVFREFVKAEKSKQWNKEKKEIRSKLKTLSQYEAEAKKEFQKWIRLRDAGKPCISCGSTTKDVDGGHYFKAEIYSGLIFDPRNCHSQCRKCNRYEGGKQAEYRMGLARRYSAKFVDELEQDSIRLRDYKFTKEELIEIKEKYRKLNNPKY